MKKHLVFILYIVNTHFYTGGFLHVQQTQNKNVILKSRYKIKIWFHEKNIGLFNDYMFRFLYQTTGCLTLCLVLGR